VLVIGAGKTAVDVSVALSDVAASTHLAARKGHGGPLKLCWVRLCGARLS